MKPLVILGNRTYAEEVADLAEQSGEWEVVAFGENFDRERCREPLRGRPVVWVDDLDELASDHAAVCAIVSTKRRIFVEQARELGFEFGTVRHPSAVVSPTAEIGPGAVVSAGVMVAAHTRIGDHAILNRGSLIGHHTSLGDFVTVSPGANVGGKAVVGDSAYIAMGSVVLDGMTVGSQSVVGAGAVVTRDVPERTQVVGIPARVVKEGIDGK